MRSANRIVRPAGEPARGTVATGIERRRHFRVVGEWPVRVRVGRELVVEATALDISLGGLLVAVDAPVAIEEGRLVEVELAREAGWAPSRVARVAAGEGPAESRWGLELGDMPPAVGARWARHVFTEARRLGYEEETEARLSRNRTSSLVCPTCGNLIDSGAPRKRLVTAAGLAEHLGVRVGQIYRMTRAGRLPCYRIGRRLRFDLDEVRRRLSSSEGV